MSKIVSENYVHSRARHKRYVCVISYLLLTLALIDGCGKENNEITDSQGRTRLELAVVGNDDNLSELILEFNKAQNNYFIEKVEYNRLDMSEADDDPSFQIDDGISKLQREIVSGNGPDIIDFGDSFTTSDICGGYTENLRDYISKEYGNINDYYYENVFDAFSYKDNFYAIPTSFYVETLVGKTKNLDGMDAWNLEQMMEFISKKDGMTLWANITELDIFTKLLLANMEQYIDWENGRALFDSESFRQLLVYSKEMPESPGSAVSSKEFGEDKVLLYPVYSDSVFDVTRIKALFGKEDIAFIGYPTENTDGTKVKTGDTVLGISASSKKKEGAFEFIKFVLSEDVQKKLQDGFSVNRKVMADYIHDAQITEYVKESDGKKELLVKDNAEIYKGESIEIYSISEEDAKKTESLLNSNFCSCNIDWNLYFVIFDEAVEYFNDNQNLDKTIENIQSRAAIYVAEKGM